MSFESQFGTTIHYCDACREKLETEIDNYYIIFKVPTRQGIGRLLGKDPSFRLCKKCFHNTYNMIESTVIKK